MQSWLSTATQQTPATQREPVVHAFGVQIGGNKVQREAALIQFVEEPGLHHVLRRHQRARQHQQQAVGALEQALGRVHSAAFGGAATPGIGYTSTADSTSASRAPGPTVMPTA